ncbi:MAG: DNA primase [Spirochaetia bacterium]|jgi:DNA primase|nr:DNA primase [Spirochaetales bacterium]MDX9783546.1 DNA primase [Spirochaetia bacterium]
MARIPESLIQEILDKTNYIAVYQEKIRLTKKGGKWWGLCPFHAEKTPSFSVDAERGLFYCFGCQKGGSLIDFLMETDKLNFIEAVEELAGKAHVPLPTEEYRSDQSESERIQLYSLYDKLTKAFHWVLRNHKDAARSRDILQHRAISEALVDKFRLGYAPADRTWLHRFLLSKGFSREFLARSGLFSGRNPEYPLFADRIIFPIADQRGRVIAFGGRLIDGEGPKYINSPDTLIFHKQENLFALDSALPSMKSQDRALVCEGYMDALSFHAAGVDYAVAPLGTAFTSQQARLLRRRVSSVILCFDSDDAGQRASERACSIATAAGLETRVLSMTEGKDASEILEKSGPEALKKLTEYSISSGDFLIRRAESLFDIASMKGKYQASQFFYPFLDALDSDVRRNAFSDLVGMRIGISPGGLIADYSKAKRMQGRPRGQTDDGGKSSSPQRRSVEARTADLFFMAAVVLCPESFDRVRQHIRLEDLEDPRARDLYLALEEASAHDAKEIGSILTLTNDDAARRYVLAVAASGELDQEPQRIVDDGIRTIQIRSLERETMKLVTEIAQRSAQGLEESGFTEGQESVQAGGRAAIHALLQKKMKIDEEIAQLKGEVDE